MPDSDLAIRPATENDIPAILKLIHLKAKFDGCPESVAATADRLQQDLFGESPLASVLLAEVGGAIAGFATYHRIYSTFLAKPGIWLDDLYLKPEFRRQGIGQTLMLELCKIADETGCARVDWTVAVDNPTGIQFYEKIGAKIQHRVRLCRLNQEAIAHHLTTLKSRQ
jgi:GNAT superfamily N-acetyltransferase